ncbi:hypothetical protein AB0J42_31875 [Nonomuraea sp. NPDC049649]|uniref:hypothetical protein n=1 Tax=Nonomuraea sp. NPDC049649 TaxID=3155776 RepID=UPI003431A650
MFSGLVRASAPLFLSMVTTLLGSLVVTAMLGRHATVTLAAFAVMTAVLSPAATAVAGALRGLAPFVAPHRDDPDAVLPVLRDARWLSLFALALLTLGGPVLGLFTGDPAVRAVALALLPLMLLAALADAVQAVQGFGLTGLKRTGASLAYFATGYGLLALAAVPVAATWGVTGLWAAVLAGNGLLALLQGTGFHRHSARVGVVTGV